MALHNRVSVLWNDRRRAAKQHLQFMVQLSAAASAAGVAVWLAACSGGADGAAFRTVRSQAGDTTVVRTMAPDPAAGMRQLTQVLAVGQLDGSEEYSFGSISEMRRAPDGSIWIFDRQAVALRKYDSTGAFIRTIGRSGSGPGEYNRVNGLAILPNGRAIMWEATSGRVRVFDADGTYLSDWVVPGSATFYTSGAVFSDVNGYGYVRSRVADPPQGDDPRRGFMFGVTGLLRYAADGSIVDSLVPPDMGVQVTQLVASVEGNTSATGVPFAAGQMWAWNPQGYFVAARGDVYAVHFQRPDGQLVRVERELQAEPVTNAEREDAIAATTTNMRMTDPNWRWNGPEVPTQKPFIRGLMTGDDGRIWVQVSAEGELIPDDERPRRAPPEGGPPVPYGRAWREPTVYDVFDTTGSFLGRVQLPLRATPRIMIGDFVWAVTTDDTGVPQIVKYMVTPGFSSAESDSQ